MNFLRFSDLCASGQATGKRVFIRADLNVPLEVTRPHAALPPEGADSGLGRPGAGVGPHGGALQITEDTRIRASLPAIRMALDAGAAVMVTSHLGRPSEGVWRPEDSLAPVAARMAELLGRPVPLVADWVDGGFEVQPGQVVLTLEPVSYTHLTLPTNREV